MKLMKQLVTMTTNDKHARNHDKRNTGKKVKVLENETENTTKHDNHTITIILIQKTCNIARGFFCLFVF